MKPHDDGDSELVKMTVYNAATQEYEERWVPRREAYESLNERLQIAQYESAITAQRNQQTLTALFEGTLKSAKSTYRVLTVMSVALFTIGVGLFVFAALYASISNTRVYSLVFAGLGASSFVALFIAKPYEDAQIALSNMIQSEMAFMAFFEQIRMWANYPWTEGELNIRRVEKASALLHKRTAEAMHDFQRYVEPEAKDGDRTASTKTKKKAHPRAGFARRVVPKPSHQKTTPSNQKTHV